MCLVMRADERCNAILLLTNNIDIHFYGVNFILAKVNILDYMVLDLHHTHVSEITTFSIEIVKSSQIPANGLQWSQIKLR